ncbi:hypothetical protein HPB52_023415 [Rhipicephalus sanguineus]|uniref:Uncharacterized protein n=1 Tax=Rhipicephalus sanguineus TaxID=34632 RepID=A0A9D4PF49_RHISA|nr:hypothetical protein HPB52_023415 [Rhipicephalus sanguineus]
MARSAVYSTQPIASRRREGRWCLRWPTSTACGDGSLIGVLVVPCTARRPLAVQDSRYCASPAPPCRLLLLPPAGRLLAAALGLWLSAIVAVLLLASWAPSPQTTGTAESLDWFRNAVPDNPPQKFVLEEGQRGRNTTPEMSAEPGNACRSGRAALSPTAMASLPNPAEVVSAASAPCGESTELRGASRPHGACPIGALSLALRATDEEATWCCGAHPAAVGVALHCPPAALALVVVRCGSALCNMLLLTTTMLRGRGLTHALLMAVVNLFSVGRGDGAYLVGLPPLPGAVQRMAALHDLFGSCGCCVLLEAAQQPERTLSVR